MVVRQPLIGADPHAGAVAQLANSILGTTAGAVALVLGAGGDGADKSGFGKTAIPAIPAAVKCGLEAALQEMKGSVNKSWCGSDLAVEPADRGIEQSALVEYGLVNPAGYPVVHRYRAGGAFREPGYPVLIEKVEFTGKGIADFLGETETFLFGKGIGHR